MPSRSILAKSACFSVCFLTTATFPLFFLYNDLMKKYIFTLFVCTLISQLNAAAKTPAQCFGSENQRFVYKKAIASTQENERITVCLKDFLKSDNPIHIQQALTALQKSNNLSAALSQTVNIFKNAKDAPTAFAAASALVSVSEELSPYNKAVFNIVSSANQEDYKKTLAVVILAATNAVDSGYTPFLTPALNAEDPVLKAYAASAYALLIPDTKTRFINDIITLYGFDKALALRAYQNTGLKKKELISALKNALKNEEEITRFSAIEWIGDYGDKKTLESLFNLSYEDASTVSAAANALASNYDIIAAKLKKEMRSSPQSSAAATAVMTYALSGGEHFDDIEKFLQSSNANEQANGARVVLSVAEILQDKTPYYKNPQLEEQRIKKLIPPLGKLANRAKDDNAKYYADAATKAIYNLIND